MQAFGRERGIDWAHYYNPVLSFGTVTATATFAVPATVQKISQNEDDVLRITHTDSKYTDYTFVPHDQLRKYDTGNFVARIGNNIKFNAAFTATSPQFGGTITCPVYVYPATFSADAAVIDHPDANWLVLAVAADRVKNDVTRKDLRADLSNQANELLMALKEDNEAQVNEVTKPWNPTTSTSEVWYQ